LSEKICKRLNNLKNCPFYDLGEIALQVLPERFEMFPAADDKSVWDMAPAGFSSGGFFNPGAGFASGGLFNPGAGFASGGLFNPGAGFASGDLANWHRPAKVGIEVGIV
jgi:hypothetical protein